MIGRRTFLGALGLTLAAPAIVHAGNIMPVRSPVLIRYQERLTFESREIWMHPVQWDADAGDWMPSRRIQPFLAPNPKALQIRPVTYDDPEIRHSSGLRIKPRRFAPYEPLSPTADPDLIAFDAVEQKWLGSYDDSDLPGTDRFKRG